MIPAIYTGDNATSYKLLSKLTEKHIKFIEKKLGEKLFSEEMDKLVTEIRSIRPKLASKMPVGTNIEWQYYKLVKAPIIKTEKETLPAWYIKENMEEILNELKANQKPEKRKLKIKRIHKNRNRVEDKIYHSKETEARINITIIQILENKKNIADIVNEWSEKEKAAFIIAWRLCQHGNANKLKDISEMTMFQAESIDPWIKKTKYEWNQGDPDENPRH
jgi:hypothetical protein